MRSRWPEVSVLVVIGAGLAYLLYPAPLGTLWGLGLLFVLGFILCAFWHAVAKTIEVWKGWRDLR